MPFHARMSRRTALLSIISVTRLDSLHSTLQVTCIETTCEARLGAFFNGGVEKLQSKGRLLGEGVALVFGVHLLGSEISYCLAIIVRKWVGGGK